MANAETLWGLGRALAVELAAKRPVVTTPLAGYRMASATACHHAMSAAVQNIMWCSPNNARNTMKGARTLPSRKSLAISARATTSHKMKLAFAALGMVPKPGT